MQSSAAQFQFAAEFVTFLAATAGLALVLLRGELMSRSAAAKTMLGLGFVMLGAGSFLSGSLIVEADSPVVLALQTAGIVAAAIGTFAWHGSPSARRLLWGGLALMAASVGFLAVSQRTDEVGLDLLLYGLLGAGSAMVVAALLVSSRRSIAARVAASAAGTLLLVVLVLSVALSSVLSSTVEDEAIRRLDARANTEASLLRSRTDEVLGRADFATRVLASPPNAPIVLDLAERPRPSPAVDQLLDEVSTLFQTFPVKLGYLSPTRMALGRSGFTAAELAELAGTSVVRDSVSGQGGRSSVEVSGERAVLIAASPVFGPSERGSPLIGLVVAATDVDDLFLEARAADDQSLSMAVFGLTKRLAVVGPQPPEAELLPLVRSVLVDREPATAVTTERFIAVRPVQAADGRPIVALVASTPTTLVGQTRDSLYRTLFLIALGGTLLALLLASVVGDRIGGGLRRLTVAAEGIQRGDLAVRARLDTDDEVGVLGRAFDSMATSIEGQTAALLDAADAETRLRNRLEAVVAGMGEALVAVDGRGRITDFNQAAEELVGVSASQARGRYADELVKLTGDDGRDYSKRLRKPSPSRWSALGMVTRADRSQVPVAASSGVLRGPGAELAGNVFVLRDLRREREVERMKTEFLSRVGHELRTPLTSIIGFSEILARRDVPVDTAKQWHEDILDSSRKLLRIVEMLEFFASTGAGRIFLRREQLHVRSVIDDEVSWWQERLEPPWSIARKVARSIPLISADRRWLKSMLHELVDNAVKFSPKGGKITIAAAPATRGRARGIELSVTDKGKGMTPEEQQQAFGEFTQGDSSDTRTFGGLGLGLPMVQRVAETHGGTVTCDSKPGKGSTLTIFLPLTADAG